MDNTFETMKKVSEHMGSQKQFDIDERLEVQRLYEKETGNMKEAVDKKLMLAGHDQELLHQGNIPEEDYTLTKREEKWLEKQDDFASEKKSAAENAIKNLKKGTVMKSRNAFGLDGGSGYKAVESRLKAEKTRLDDRYKLIQKAIREFSQGTGGTEFTEVQDALKALAQQESLVKTRTANMSDEEKAADNGVDPSYYEAVMRAAHGYVKTHNRTHFTRQGSRRFSLAKVLSEDIQNMDYILERSAGLDEEIRFAKEDVKASYIKDDDIKEVTENLAEAEKDIKDAFTEYSAEKPVFKVTSLVKFGNVKPAGVDNSMGMYSPYQFMNAIKRGIISRADVDSYYENYEASYLKEYGVVPDKAELERIEEERAGINEIYRQMDLIDSTFENSTGIRETVKLYRGFKTPQISRILQMDQKDIAAIASQDTKDGALALLERKLDSLVGKVYQDDGFTSTSMDRTVADNYSFDDMTQPIGFMFEVVARKGTKGIDIDDVSEFNGSEREVLLKPGSRFLIRGFSIDKHFLNKKPIVVVHAEVR